MSTLLLVRHGQSTANRDRLLPGRSLAAPLTELGCQQADRAAAEVAGRLGGPAAVLSSDVERARQTAQRVARRLGVRFEQTELLREQYLGELEGRPVAELSAQPVPEGFDITEVGWGGGESMAEVQLRMRRLLGWLAGRDDLPDAVVLVGHGHALAALVALLEGRGHRDIDWAADSLRLAEVRPVEWRPLDWLGVSRPG